MSALSAIIDLENVEALQSVSITEEWARDLKTGQRKSQQGAII